jgi:hypothetical protein
MMYFLVTARMLELGAVDAVAVGGSDAGCTGC